MTQSDYAVINVDKDGKQWVPIEQPELVQTLRTTARPVPYVYTPGAPLILSLLVNVPIIIAMLIIIVKDLRK